MSKIGKINIPIPDKVKVLLSGNIVNIEGPLGKKSLNIDLDVFDLKIDEQLVAQGCLRHVAIDAQTRRRCALPDGVDRWLEASSLGRIQPL